MQVVRPATNSLWRTLRSSGRARRALTVDEAVNDVMQMIAKKRQGEHLTATANSLFWR